MFSLRNKNKIIKLAMIVIFASLFLTACSSDSAKMTPNGQNATSYEDAQKNAQANCWQKSILNLFYDNMSRVTLVTLNKFTEGALAISMIIFAIWLIVKLLAYVSSVTENSGAELWNEIFKKLFLCFACGIIANNPTMIMWLLNTVIFPIYIALLRLGSEIVSVATKATSGQFTGDEWYANTSASMSCASLPGTIDMTSDGMPTYPREMMGCLICNVNQQMSLGLALAFKLMGTNGIGLLGWFAAAILGLTFTIIRLGFVFYLVDTLFRMSIMLLLLPLFILGYAFKYTEKYFTTAFSNIISSAAYMLVIAIITSISIMAVTSYLVNTMPELNDTSLLNDPATVDKYKAANQPILIILCFSFLVVSTLNIAKILANALILPQSSITNTMQKSIKGALMKTIKVLAAIFGSPAAKKLLDKATEKMEKSDTYQNLKESKMGRAANKVSSGIKNTRQKVSNFNEKLNKLSGRK